MKDVIKQIDRNDFNGFNKTIQKKLDEKMLNHPYIQEQGSIIKHYSAIKDSFQNVKV